MPEDDSQDASLQSANEGGVMAQHAVPGTYPFLVGPSTSSEFNTARLRLIPVACWRVDDIRFAFDSSFISSDAGGGGSSIRDDLASLSNLLKNNPGCPLSVFGHADPVGSDDYNKLLSGRRATTVYALLISNVDSAKAVSLWQKVAGQESWGQNQRQMMQSTTGLPAGTADSTLIAAYLKALCPPELQLDPHVDFLARGADAGGKADYQGCSEFNPVLLFSEEEQAQFDASTPKDPDLTAARNARNQPNRRAMVLIFRKGSQVDPAKWPCPRATEGTAGCIKRFWSDGEQRRSTHLPGADRKFEDTKDTFACRFYQRIAEGSPCGGTVPLVHISVILYLNYPAEPLANEDFRLILSDRVVTGNTGDDGLVSQDKVPSGDYRLEVADRVTYVPAIPLSMDRIPWLLDVDAANGDASPTGDV